MNMDRLLSSARLVLLWAIMPAVIGELNLYMNETETRRLLGIEGELYYVRDNIVNDYALTFNVPLGPSIDTIYFTWYNKNPAFKMWYNQTITVSEVELLRVPKTSLPSNGFVPNRPTPFWLSLECTGIENAEVDIHLMLSITLFNTLPPRLVDIRRRKTCLKGQVRKPEYVHPIDDDSDVPEIHLRPRAETTLSARAVVFYSTMALVGLLLVTAAVALVLFYCRAKKRANERLSDTSSAALTNYVRADTPKSSLLGGANGAVGGANGNVGGVQSGGQPMANGGGTLARQRALAQTPIMQLTPEQVQKSILEIRIDPQQLQLGSVLLEGSFGRILRATLFLGPRAAGEKMDVCIKTVTDAASPSQLEVFLRECCLLKNHLHPNINPLLASCFIPRGGGDEEDPENMDTHPPLLIFPYLSHGNLKLFLRRCKISDMSTQQVLSTQQLVYISIQIAAAVDYLHSKRIVHKDIAARNCLIDGDLVVRLGDNALSRDLFPADYHCLGNNENRPVKWLALEALLHNDYTFASDVWSFGVAMWEVMTGGQQPYQDVDAFEMAAYLKDGFRVSQPHNCPDELFAVMACCWSLVPAERPHISQLSACLHDFYSALCQYI